MDCSILPMLTCPMACPSMLALQVLLYASPATHSSTGYYACCNTAPLPASFAPWTYMESTHVRPRCRMASHHLTHSLETTPKRHASNMIACAAQPAFRRFSMKAPALMDRSSDDVPAELDAVAALGALLELDHCRL